MSRYPVTITLVVSITAVFILQQITDLGTSAGQMPWSFAAGGITTATFPGEPWRLVTGTFLHAGFIHFAMNAWVLLQVGTVFELLFGSARMLLLYTISALGGALCTSVFIEPGHVSVGASGAIFGVAAGLLVMMGTIAAKKSWAASLRVQLAIFAIGSIVLGLFSPEVDNNAHLGGAISGLVLGSMLRSSSWLMRSTTPAE
jgi:rhomboid protease GluP